MVEVIEHAIVTTADELVWTVGNEVDCPGDLEDMMNDKAFGQPAALRSHGLSSFARYGVLQHPLHPRCRCQTRRPN
jgi:hypothetical protein